jgi:hypothetical protein
LLGVGADDAVLAVGSGAFLGAALASAGVPPTHALQREARAAVKALAHRSAEERLKEVLLLWAALDKAAEAANAAKTADSDAAAGNSAASVASVAAAAECHADAVGSLVTALQCLGAPRRSVVVGMAHLLVPALLRRAGVPAEHAFLEAAAHAARVQVMCAKHMDEACALLGIEPQSLAAAQGGAPVGMGQVQAVVCDQLGLAEQELRSALAAGAHGGASSCASVAVVQLLEQPAEDVASAINSGRSDLEHQPAATRAAASAPAAVPVPEAQAKRIARGQFKVPQSANPALGPGCGSSEQQAAQVPWNKCSPGDDIVAPFRLPLHPSRGWTIQAVPEATNSGKSVGAASSDLEHQPAATRAAASAGGGMLEVATGGQYKVAPGQRQTVPPLTAQLAPLRSEAAEWKLVEAESQAEQGVILSMDLFLSPNSPCDETPDSGRISMPESTFTTEL